MSGGDRAFVLLVGGRALDVVVEGAVGLDFVEDGETPDEAVDVVGEIDGMGIDADQVGLRGLRVALDELWIGEG